MTNELIRLYVTDKSGVGFEVSPWIVIPLSLFLVVMLILRISAGRRFQVVTVEIPLGGIGTVHLRPNWEDIRMAHKIWTELVTRKAALPIDPEHDVIIEVYESWYALFQRVRQLVSEIPAESIRKEESTQAIVTIAIDSLNLGLRPHLTRWQARFRHWWLQTEEQRKNISPQQHQKTFPEYGALIADMKKVNEQLIQYAGELQKIVHGSE